MGGGGGGGNPRIKDPLLPRRVQSTSLAIPPSWYVCFSDGIGIVTPSFNTYKKQRVLEKFSYSCIYNSALYE